MNDRFSEIKRRILEIANSDKDIKAIIAIGSSARNKVRADEYSDLDLLIAADDAKSWLYGDLPAQLGNIKISFIENSLGGAIERRVLYENSLDVDMIVFTPEQLTEAIRGGIANWVCNRGYSVLYDTMNFEKLLSENVSDEITHSNLTEAEYNNIVNDFCFHTVWAAKKILRGELWTAKMCIDAYLKNYLLKIIEAYSVCRYNIDVWHDGRFLDTWADDRIKEALPKCFARYDKTDMVIALSETKKLFSQLAEKTAEICSYNYPKTAVDYADCLLSEYLGI